MAYASKAAQKRDLELIQKQVQIIGEQYRVAFLELPREQQTVRKSDLYYSSVSAATYNAKKDKALRAEYPELAALADKLLILADQYKSIKAQEIVKPVKAEVQAKGNPVTMKLFADICEALAKQDEAHKAGYLAFCEKAREALFAYKTSPEYKADDLQTRGLRKDAITGSKAITQCLEYRADWAAAVTSILEDTYRNRNARIARALELKGIERVVSSDVETANGFYGKYAVETNQGQKILTVRSILAGGHNIQCLHNRVLVNIK